MDGILNTLHTTINRLYDRNLNNNGRFIFTDGRPGTKDFQVELQGLLGQWLEVNRNSGEGVADLMTAVIQAELKYRELNGYKGYEKND